MFVQSFVASELSASIVLFNFLSTFFCTFKGRKLYFFFTVERPSSNNLIYKFFSIGFH